MALKVMQECRKRNVDCIVAPYEADAQLAFFSIEGIADLVITEDSDLLLFGCKRVSIILTYYIFLSLSVLKPLAFHLFSR